MRIIRHEFTRDLYMDFYIEKFGFVIIVIIRKRNKEEEYRCVVLKKILWFLGDSSPLFSGEVGWLAYHAITFKQVDTSFTWLLSTYYCDVLLSFLAFRFANNLFQWVVSLFWLCVYIALIVDKSWQIPNCVTSPGERSSGISGHQTFQEKCSCYVCGILWGNFETWKATFIGSMWINLRF